MKELTQELLKELLHYDPETGVFAWRYRDIKFCKNKALQTTWNKQFSYKICGHVRETNKNNYCWIAVLNKVYRAHRLAWLYVNGNWPVNHIDHINGDGLDNRILNLRDVTNSENRKNGRLHPKSKSGYSGIYWNKINKKWIAQIGVDGKVKYLGSFSDIGKAIECRKLAEKNNGFHENHGRRL